MYHGVALCSCGHRFSDYSDIENHLVQKHEKLSADQETSSRKAFSFSDVLKDVINNVNEEATNIGQLDIALPPKTFAVVLDEETIDGGRIENVNCDECSVTCWSFKTLKDHYLRQHPGLWTSKETCVKVPRIIFSKPNREHQNRLPKSWHYDFYCPIPGCKYHLNQHLQDTQEQPKTFRSAALLKQHYSKIHASKSKICPKCEAGKFPFWNTQVSTMNQNFPRRKKSCIFLALRPSPSIFKPSIWSSAVVVGYEMQKCITSLLSLLLRLCLQPSALRFSCADTRKRHAADPFNAKLAIRYSALWKIFKRIVAGKTIGSFPVPPASPMLRLMFVDSPAAVSLVLPKACKRGR